MVFSPFIRKLLSDRCGRELRHSSDCEQLVCDIESASGEHIGVNTMKRLLGFIDDERSPRISTLEIIAQYLGYDSWEALQLADAGMSNSAFNPGDELVARHLDKGQQVMVTYLPDRELTLEYIEDNMFRVIASKNGKLMEGDMISLSHLVRHYPLIVSDVVRKGKCLGSFTAGKQQGIDFKLL